MRDERGRRHAPGVRLPIVDRDLLRLAVHELWTGASISRRAVRMRGAAMSGVPHLSRRSVVSTTALGITSVGLPPSLASASVAAVSSWSSTLTFSEVVTDGFTVTWDLVG